jgi:hypothetical protein
MKSRRSFLRALGAAPLIAKGAAEEAAKSMAGISTTGAICASERVAVSLGGGTNLASSYPSPLDIKQMFFDAAFRELIESASYQNNRHVSFLDHDIASKRSWSLAAKVTFQRQRNVARDLDGYSQQPDTPWSLILKRWNPLG